MATPLNYAVEYSRALSQAFPYSLNFGALYSTPNNGRYRWVNAKTIEIPSISTTGRVNADRDSISVASRNYDNAWETKTLTNERKWSTLIHPMDVIQTNLVTTIANITKVYNEESKFPEMDAYTVSKIYADWTATVDPVTGTSRVPDTTLLTTQNILSVFDDLMLKMDNERVPANGRILYVTHEIKKMLNNADRVSRSISVESGPNAIDRRVNRLDEVEIIAVPASLMKTLYDFTVGWSVAEGADQINMFLIHPISVITPVSYTFSKLDEPAAGSEGKYIYYEESFEDVFILNKKAGAIQFNITPANPLKAVTVAPDAADATYPWTSLSPSDFQENVAVSNGKITGTLRYIADGLSPSGPLSGSGHFLALKFSNVDAAATSVKVGLVPSTGTGLVELLGDPDMNGVFKITDTAQQLTIISTDNNGIKGTRKQVFDLSDLVLATE